MKYKIEVRTVAGMFAQYDGYVEFYSNFDLSKEEVEHRAFRELKRGAFDRHTKSMFKFGEFTVE